MNDAEREALIGQITQLHRDRDYEGLIRRCRSVTPDDLREFPEGIVKLADAYIATLRKADARKLFDRHEAALNTLTETAKVSTMLIRAHLLNDVGKLSDAEKLYQQVVRAVGEGASKRQVAIAHNALGIIAANRGQVRQALGGFARSSLVWRETGDLKLLGAASHNAGIVSRDWGSRTQAMAHFTTAAEYFERGGVNEERLICVGERSALHARLGDLDIAEQLARQALHLGEQSDSQGARISGQFYWGMHLIAVGEIHQAVNLLERILARLTEASNSSLLGAIYEELAICAAALGDRSRTEEYFAKATAHFQKMDAPLRVSRLTTRRRLSSEAGKASPRWVSAN